MIKVAGHWEIGYMTPIQEQYYWSYPIRDFEVSEWLMSPVSGIYNQEHLNLDLIEFKDTKEMLSSCGSLKRVFIEPRTQHQNPDTIWLHEYSHPEDCVYIFGSAHFNPTLGYLRDEDDVVSIKTKKDGGILWSNQCVAMVLYDRMVKSWQ